MKKSSHCQGRGVVKLPWILDEKMLPWLVVFQCGHVGSLKKMMLF